MNASTSPQEEQPLVLPGEESPSTAAVPSVRTLQGLEHLALQFLLAEATELAGAGKFAQAEARLAAIPEGRKNPQVLDLLARIRAQQGRNAEAVELWQMTVQMDPANADYRAGLAYAEKAGRRITHPSRLAGLIIGLLAGLVILALFATVLVRLDGVARAVSAIPQPPAAAAVDLSSVEQRLSDLQTSIAEAQSNLGNLQTKVDESSATAAADKQSLEGQLTALKDGQQALLDSQSVTVAPLDLKLDVPGFTLAAEGDAWVITAQAGVFRYGWLLNEDARPGLETLARQLAPLSGQAKVDLIGYAADDEQDPNFNLGMIRAVLVSDVLIAAGLPEGMINVTPAAGRPAPFANDTSAHRAANRTVIFVVHR